MLRDTTNLSKSRSILSIFQRNRSSIKINLTVLEYQRFHFHALAPETENNANCERDAQLRECERVWRCPVVNSGNKCSKGSCLHCFVENAENADCRHFSLNYGGKHLISVHFQLTTCNTINQLLMAK